MREISETWKSLDDIERRHYADQASKSVQEYNQALSKFTSEDYILWNHRLSLLKKAKHGKTNGRQGPLVDPLKPKVPSNAFIRFMKDFRDSPQGKALGVLSLVEQSKEAARLWKESPSREVTLANLSSTNRKQPPISKITTSP